MYTQTSEQPFVNDMDTSIPPVFSMPLHKKQLHAPMILLKSNAESKVSESEYWDKFYHDKLVRYEWNNGVLEVKDMPTYISIVCANFLLDCIRQYLHYNPIATLITCDLAFSFSIQNTKRIRRPDYAIILKSNPIQIALNDCSYAGTYDICIQLLSDTKKEYITKDTVTRKTEYANANVSEYYIIDINKQKHTAFYRLDSNGTYVDIKPKNGVIQSTVLPGFQFRIQDLYDPPDLNELIDDDVYQHYMLLDLQKERRDLQKERRDLQKERHEKEKALSEKEKALSEKEEALSEKEEAFKEIKRLKQLLNRKYK